MHTFRQEEEKVKREILKGELATPSAAELVQDLTGHNFHTKIHALLVTIRVHVLFYQVLTFMLSF